MKNEMKRENDYINVNSWLDSLADEYQNNSAFMYEKDNQIVTVSYRLFQENVRKCATFINRKYEKGAHIGVVCKNTYDCFLYIISIIYSGRVAVLLDDISSKDLVNEYAKNADCCTTLTLSDIHDHITKSKQEAQIETFDRSEKINNKPAIIYFTSGTSGHKTMVLISHNNVTCSITETSKMYRKYKGMHALAHLPLYHMYGFMSVLWDISSGGIVIFSQSMKYFAKDLVKYQPVFIETVPLVLEYIYKKINRQIIKTGREGSVKSARILCRCLNKIGIDIRKKVFQEIHEQLGSKLEVITCGGAAIDPEIIKFFNDIGIAVLQGYGMTETSTFVSVCLESDNRIGSVGSPMEYNQIRIVDSEVEVKGCNVMLGYYNDPKATADAFDGEWLKTGDIGYFDKKGHLFISGRKKNLIILSNGENISPEIIENNLLKSTLVDEVVVSELSGHIHAEIYSEQLRFTDYADAKKMIKCEIDQYNKCHEKSMYVETFTLRKEPFEKTTTMKIIRKMEY